MTMVVAALGLQAGFAVVSAASEDDALPPSPDEPMMIVSGGEGEAAKLYPEGQIFPASAYICLPDDSGFVAFELADGETRVLMEGGCNVRLEAPVSENAVQNDPRQTAPTAPLLPPPVAETPPPAPPTPDDARQAEMAIEPDRVAADRPARRGGSVVVRSSGPDATAFPAGRRLDPRSRICLREGSRLTILSSGRTRVMAGPGCHRAATRGPSRSARISAFIAPRSGPRARTGTIRGGEAVPAAALIVIRGSQRSLAFYPVGSRLADGARLCLPTQAGFITLQRTTGGTVTYGDDGCNRVIEEPESRGESSGVGNGP